MGDKAFFFIQGTVAVVAPYGISHRRGHLIPPEGILLGDSAGPHKSPIYQLIALSR